MCLAKITTFLRIRYINWLRGRAGVDPSITSLMLYLLRLRSNLPVKFYCSRRDLVLENLAHRRSAPVILNQTWCEFVNFSSLHRPDCFQIAENSGTYRFMDPRAFSVLM